MNPHGIQQSYTFCPTAGVGSPHLIGTADISFAPMQKLMAFVLILHFEGCHLTGSK